MKKALTIVFSFLFVSMLSAQWQSLRPVDLIQEASSQRASLKKVNPFQIASAKKNIDLPASLEKYTLLNLDSSFYGSLNQRSAASLIEFTIPSQGRSKDLTLELVEVDINNQGHQAILLPAKTEMNVTGGKHFRGIVKGNPNSIAAISVFEDQIMGLISGHNDANIVIGKLAQDDTHILYNDAEISELYEGLGCTTESDGYVYSAEELFNHQRSATNNQDNCVKLYIEADYDIYQRFGSVDATTSFVEGFMNQVMTIYANENIRTALNPVGVWTENPNYSGDPYQILTQWQNQQYNNWEGTLACLVSNRSVGGIAAGFEGICNANRRKSMSFASIDNRYSNVPTYSWTVDIVTHELGHLFGSRHTHACVWNGNNTQIDGCGDPEGGCSRAPRPSRGTIMSYCHLAYGVGKDLSLGFGEQPGNVIRNRVYNASCLSNDCSSSDTDTETGSNPCINAYENNNTSSAAATIESNGSIEASLGAYGDKDYYQVSLGAGEVTITLDGPEGVDFDLSLLNASGNSLGTSTDYGADESVALDNIVAGTYYVYVYGYQNDFSTSCYTLTVNNPGGAQESCTAPSNLAVSYITESSAHFTWNASNDANSYSLEIKGANESNWSVISSSITGTEFTITGFAPSTSYNVRVKANCSTMTSDYISDTFATLSEVVVTPTCASPSNFTVSNILENQANFNWTASSDALSYTLEIKQSTASSWYTISTSLTETTVTLTNIPFNTNYDIRVRANCSDAESDFVQTSFTSGQEAVAPTCDMPSNFIVSETLETSASLSWAASLDANSYRIEVKTVDATSWTIVYDNLNDTTANLSDLVPNTAYEVRLRANCPSLNSTYLETAFTTLEIITCATPTDLAVSYITENSAHFTWNENTEADTYIFEIREPNTTTNWRIMSSSLTDPAYTITGFAPNTNYEIRVRTNCADSDSDYSSISFTTLEETIDINCVDAYENNNELASAYTLPNNTTIQAALTQGDFDFYDIFTENVANINFELNAPEGKDYSLTVYGNSNGRWSYIGTTRYLGANDKLETSNQPAGRYIIIVTYNNYYQDYSDDCYSLSIETLDLGMSRLENKTRLYPNPTAGKYVFLDTDVADATYSISNIEGRVIQEGEVTEQLDISALKEGVYIVKVKKGGIHVFTEKLVIISSK